MTISTVTSSERRMSASSRREAGSRLDDGSSSTRISGSIASTVATATRRRWPNDRWCGGRSTKSAIPTWSSASRDPARRARRPRSPRLAGPNATSSRTVGMNSWSSGSWKTTPTRRRISVQVVLGRPAARDTETVPGAGGEDAVEVQHQRGLAGAVGAEQGDPLALVHVEVDAEQRLVAVGVGEGQAADVEDGGSQRTVTECQRAAECRPRHCRRRVMRQACRCSRGTAWRGGPARRARRSG